MSHLQDRWLIEGFWGRDGSPSRPNDEPARPAVEPYQDQPGYCKSAKLDDICKHDYVLTPGRYVGAAPLEDDGIPFEVKMKDFSDTLYGQMKESVELDAVIRENSAVLENRPAPKGRNITAWGEAPGRQPPNY